MKRLFALFLTVLTFCLFFLGSESVIADADYASGVAIDAEHFPDESFRQIVARYDQTADGVLSPEELGSITEISLFWASVNSLQGIEYFINLTSLDCSGAKVSPFDLSCLPNLKYLNCPYNGWEYLDIRGCLALEELHCEGNRLQALIVSGAPSLRVLNCQGNLLQELDVSGCVSLEQLDCSCNNLYSLDLNGCSSLLALNCSANHLSSIDLSQAGCLQLLCCNFNQLSALNVSCCPGLVTVDCIGNNMSQLILGNQSALKNIFCGFNALTSLELSSCPNLEKMNCCYNQIDSLDISACPILTSTVSSPGSVEYRLSPSVVTYSVGAVDASYDYSLDSDPEKKLTLDTRVQLTPSLYRPIAEATCPLVSSDPEDWGMPSVALDYWHILTVRAQGAERLNYMDTTASNDYPSRYYLYDIDKDGSPELIVEGSGAEAIRQGYVFTGNQGHAVYLGAIHMGHTSLCTFPEGNGILCYNAHMGSMSIRKISLNNGQLMSEEVIPLTDGYMSSFDYPSVSTLVPGAANLAYYCKATNPILFRTWQGIVQWLETQEDYDYPNVSWPKDNEQFYSDIISSNGFFILRGVINRMQYTPYISFSSLLCHNKQLINSHFYRGVSELPYKLLFAVIYTHLEFRYEVSHTITSHHVHHFHQTRIPDGTLLDYMVQYRKPLFPQFFLYPKKFLPENNPHHKEFHLRPYIQNNANQ